MIADTNACISLYVLLSSFRNPFQCLSSGQAIKVLRSVSSKGPIGVSVTPLIKEVSLFPSGPGSGSGELALVSSNSGGSISPDG